MHVTTDPYLLPVSGSCGGRFLPGRDPSKCANSDFCNVRNNYLIYDQLLAHRPRLQVKKRLFLSLKAVIFGVDCTGPQILYVKKGSLIRCDEAYPPAKLNQYEGSSTTSRLVQIRSPPENTTATIQTIYSSSRAKRMPPERNTDGMPSFDKASLLVIILTDLPETSKADLTQGLQKSLNITMQIQTWTPSNILLQSISKKSPYRDSQANLYALAVLAHRYSWSSFIVVDELTKRQFIETCRFGEDKMVSMILVTTGTRLSSNTKDEILVVARRVNEEVEGGVVEVLKGIEPERLAIQNREKRGLPGGYTGGLIRHDPDRSVFSADRPVLGREEYASAVATALSSHLPIELVTDILSLVDNDSPQRIPAWESPENEQRLVIFLLCHTTTTEYNQTRESLENGMRKHVRIENDQKVEIELIPWEHHGIASRRELITFWYRYRLHEHPSVTGLNFLLGPIHDVDSAQFGIVNSCHGDDIPALSTRTTLAGMIQGMREECSKIRYLDPDDVQAEGMYVPDQPFYPNPPPWLPVGEGDESYEFIGIFYLTNQLTNEQDWAIREFIKSQCEGEEETLYSKECCYIPWKSGSGSVDATMEDVWEIVWNAYTYAAERGRDWHCLFFIDRQSAFDCSLLMAVQDWYRGGDSAVKGFLRGITCPRLRGFYYTRVDGNEAHVIHFNIDKPLRGIETFDDVTRFRRPDWPGPGVMPGDDGSIPDASGPFNGISP